MPSNSASGSHGNHGNDDALGIELDLTPPLSAAEEPDPREPAQHDQLLPSPSTAPDDETMSPPPRRSLTFLDGLAVVVGVQIGSGIFTAPAAVLSSIRAPLPAVLVWLAAGALAWTGAASFIELGSRVPRNGGIQEYLRHCYNDKCAAVATWSLIFMIKPASIAMVSLIFAEYLLGGLGSGAPGAASGAWAARGLAVLVLAAFTLLNCVGTRVSASVANVFFVLKLLGLASVVVAGLMFGVARGSGSDAPARDDPAEEDGPGTWASVGTYTDAILTAMFAYSGWESLGYVGGEIQSPSRNISRVLNSAMMIVVSLYILAIVSYLIVLPPAQLKDTDTIALDFGTHLFGRPGRIFFSLVVALSCLGALDVKVFTLGRLTQAAVQRGYLPDVLHMQSPKERGSLLQRLPLKPADDEQIVPIRLLIFNFAMATAYIAVGSFRHLVIFNGMADNIICWVTVIGIPMLRILERRMPSPKAEPTATRTSILNPIIFCAASGFVVIQSALVHWIDGLILICFIVGGIVATRFLKKMQETQRLSSG